MDMKEFLIVIVVLLFGIFAGFIGSLIGREMEYTRICEGKGGTAIKAEGKLVCADLSKVIVK